MFLDVLIIDFISTMFGFSNVFILIVLYQFREHQQKTFVMLTSRFWLLKGGGGGGLGERGLAS